MKAFKMLQESEQLMIEDLVQDIVSLVQAVASEDSSDGFRAGTGKEEGEVKESAAKLIMFCRTGMKS